MKRIWLMPIGILALVPLQGCMATAGDGTEEQTGSASQAVSSCTSNNGLNPTRAELAVAMADELGRWDTARDLAIVNGRVSLSSTAVCLKNNCMHTRAILGQQDPQISQWVAQTVFNPVTFGNDLYSSFDRQTSKLNDLTQNHPDRLPGPHKLRMVAGPTDLGTGACGAHYVFQADHLDGTPLTAAEASNLGNALCYFGYGTCGSNTYVSFVVTGQNCPSGRTCVAVDPLFTVPTPPPATGPTSAPTYPLNKVWDPYNVLLNTKCTTTGGVLGTMKSMCSVNSGTCGYLYCTP